MSLGLWQEGATVQAAQEIDEAMRRVVTVAVGRFPVRRSGPYRESEDELLDTADGIRFEFWLAVRALTGRLDGQPGGSSNSASDNEVRSPLGLHDEQKIDERLPFETPMPEAEAVTIAEAARFLGYSSAKRYELADAGKFPVHVGYDGTRRVVSSLDLAAHAGCTPEEALERLQAARVEAAEKRRRIEERRQLLEAKRASGRS